MGIEIQWNDDRAAEDVELAVLQNAGVTISVTRSDLVAELTEYLSQAGALPTSPSDRSAASGPAGATTSNTLVGGWLGSLMAAIIPRLGRRQVFITGLVLTLAWVATQIRVLFQRTADGYLFTLNGG